MRAAQSSPRLLRKGGPGMKDMVKKVMDGDPKEPVDVLYSPSMVAVEMDITAAGLMGHIPVRGNCILNAAGDQEQCQRLLLQDAPF